MSKGAAFSDRKARFRLTCSGTRLELSIDNRPIFPGPYPLKFIISTAAILLLCATGTFTYFWYHTNHTVKQAISALAPHAQISYGSVVSSVYPGILGVSDVDIIVEGKRLHADSITFSADTILELYALQKNPYQYALSQPRLDIRNLRSPVPAIEFDLLAELLDHPYLQFINNLDAIGCKQRDSISASDMTSMGYHGLHADINLWSGPQPFSSGYNVELSVSVPGQADYRISVSYADVPKGISQALQQLSRLDLESVNISSKDRGYNERLQEFCAAAMGIDAQRYQSHHLGAVAQLFRRQGITLSDSDLAIYSESLHKGASKQLRIKPRRDFAIEDLRFFKPADYRDLLGINFSANNRQAKQQKDAKIAEASPEIPSKPIAVQHQVPDTQLQEDLSWDDLNKALHRNVVVYTESGGVHRGRVEQISTRSLVLKKSFGPDSMSFTIDRKRFSYAERVN